MLRLENIKKDYKVADNFVHALKGINLSFRKSEFVSILGPSGCGKTTMLNIIGGLDKYTDGNLFISGKSTKEFNDRDWDIYRNHRIGFIFQSYNLIPHQTILENVELALTISGMAKAERVEKAKKALDRVGLKDQYNKKPNQLSGGQCQRVAIARALVNEPEILLADEPTGALDTVTSVQIMELIKEISKEKLVIMVTHNPELAMKYSTRIVKLIDGLVIEDSNPFNEEDEIKEVTEYNNMLNEQYEMTISNMTEKEKKAYNKTLKENAKMSFTQAFKLSTRNLRSKLKRTLMVVVAGSIGIIGVTTVLSVSTGVKDYIADMQDDMLSGNPIMIEQMAVDMDTILNFSSLQTKKDALDSGDWVNVSSIIGYLIQNQDALESLVSNNEITKDYVDYILSMPKENYNAISLDYGVDMTSSIYTDFSNGTETKKMSLNAINQTYSAAISKLGVEEGSTSDGPYSQYSAAITSLTSPISQSVPNNEYIESQYKVLSGRLPQNSNECILVLNKDKELSDLVLAQLGYYSQREFYDLVYNKMIDSNKYYNKDKFNYDELLNKEFTWYKNDDIYEKNVNRQNTYIASILQYKNELDNATTDQEKEVAQTKLTMATSAYFTADDLFDYKSYIKDEDNLTGTNLKVCGIVMPKENISYGCLRSGLLYTEEFARNAVKQNVNSNIVNFVKNNRVITANNKSQDFGISVKYELDYYWESKINGLDLKGFDKKDVYVGRGDTMSTLAASFGLQLDSNPTMKLADLGGFTDNNGNIIPETISIYPIDFNQKDKVTKYLDKWNSITEYGEEVTFNVLDDDLNLTYDAQGNVITKTLSSTDRTEIKYTDNVALIINMINTMINIITYALVAFTALSLVVSTVMVGIITYVSVVERIKEIGVIRSLGGRKKDVSHLFNAETFVIGLASGAFGVAVTGILSLIINLIVKAASGGAVTSIAHLTIPTAIVMTVLSILLTLISGLIPARSAARKDPVDALRTE